MVILDVQPYAIQCEIIQSLNETTVQYDNRCKLVLAAINKVLEARKGDFQDLKSLRSALYTEIHKALDKAETNRQSTIDDFIREPRVPQSTKHIRILKQPKKRR